MQANTGIAPLDAVLATAAMVTPEQTPTVAAQVVQAAQQKMQPQGIMGGMPQARQDFRTAAEIDNMKRMQMQQAMQQMAAQMTARPAGIEGLPAQNMQTFEAAQGGVVGYAGKDESLVKNQVEEILRKAPMSRTPEENAILRASGIDLTQRPMGDASGIMALDKFLRSPFLREAFTGGAHKLTSDELKRRGDTGAVTEKIFRMLGGAKSSPEPQLTATTTGAAAELPQASYDHESRVGLASKPISGGEASRSDAAAPAPRPPAPAPRPPAPQSGIAQLVEPTPEQAMASARSIAGFPATDKLRTKEEAYLEALKRQPAAGQQGLAALQEQQAALKAMYDKAEKQSNINAAIQWLLGADTPGGPARSSIAFAKQEDERRRVYQELQVANATKRDAIIDLQNAREANNARAALEAEQRIRAAEMDVAKAEATLSGQLFQTQGELYRTKMTSADRAADRAQQALLEGKRLQQQAELNGQTRLANSLNAANNIVASAIEKMDRDLEKRFGTTVKMYQMMKPEDVQKNPQLAAGYQQYMQERENIYKMSVEPAVRQRDRLAAQVMSGGGGNVQRYDAKGNPIK